MKPTQDVPPWEWLAQQRKRGIGNPSPSPLHGLRYQGQHIGNKQQRGLADCRLLNPLDVAMDLNASKQVQSCRINLLKRSGLPRPLLRRTVFLHPSKHVGRNWIDWGRFVCDFSGLY